MFPDVNCYSKCVPMDEFGFWSNFTDTLYYVKAEVDQSITYSYDQRRHQIQKPNILMQPFQMFPVMNTY